LRIICIKGRGLCAAKSKGWYEARGSAPAEKGSLPRAREDNSPPCEKGTARFQTTASYRFPLSRRGKARDRLVGQGGKRDTISLNGGKKGRRHWCDEGKGDSRTAQPPAEWGGFEKGDSGARHDSGRGGNLAPVRRLKRGDSRILAQEDGPRCWRETAKRKGRWYVIAKNEAGTLGLR